MLAHAHTSPLVQRMKRICLVSLWLFVAALSVATVYRLVPFASARRSVIPSQPKAHTVITQERHIRRDGSSTLVAEYATAVRSDGARVWESRVFDATGGVRSWKRFIDYPSGVQAELDNLREVVTTQRIGVRGFQDSSLEPRQNCLTSSLGGLAPGTVLVGREALRGHPVFKVSIPKRNMTVWYTEDLNCAELQARGVTRGVDVHHDAVDIKTGEPRSELFTVPPRFKEVPPSVLRRMDPRSPEAQRLDDYYRRHPPE